MHRPDIKKHLQNKPKPVVPIGEIGKPKKHALSLMDSPMFELAKSALPNLPPKFKYVIGGVLYLVVMGIVATIYLIIQLISLFI